MKALDLRVFERSGDAKNMFYQAPMIDWLHLAWRFRTQVRSCFHEVHVARTENALCIARGHGAT